MGRRVSSQRMPCWVAVVAAHPSCVFSLALPFAAFLVPSTKVGTSEYDTVLDVFTHGTRHAASPPRPISAGTRMAGPDQRSARATLFFVQMFEVNRARAERDQPGTTRRDVHK